MCNHKFDKNNNSKKNSRNVYNSDHKGERRAGKDWDSRYRQKYYRVSNLTEIGRKHPHAHPCPRPLSPGQPPHMQPFSRSLGLAPYNSPSSPSLTCILTIWHLSLYHPRFLPLLQQGDHVGLRDGESCLQEKKNESKRETDRWTSQLAIAVPGLRLNLLVIRQERTSEEGPQNGIILAWKMRKLKLLP